MERLLSQGQGEEQNALTFVVGINDYQWSCANTILAKLSVALAPAPAPFMRVYWFILWLQLVYSQTTKSKKTGNLSGALEAWGALDAPDSMLCHIH